MQNSKKSAAILHGAGYAGGELVRLLLSHEDVSLTLVTSRAFAGEPLWKAHPVLRGQTDLAFSAEDEVDFAGLDAVFIAAEHGKGAKAVLGLREAGFTGAIVDLSADFRFKVAGLYERWFGFTHPAPELLATSIYGIPEIYAPYPAGTTFVANPGCFATGVSMALWPLSCRLDLFDASVTALTGASGSGARPKETTHFPTRDGNVRAYKVLSHQHLPEIQQVLGPHANVAFAPVSGPWTRGIWGTAHVALPEGTGAADVAGWYEEAFAGKPFVRLWPDHLPELRFSVGTPFIDIGWVVRDGRLVVGFALDNLLKGAASQAVQNLNLILGLPETTGLLAGGVAEHSPL
jgi:LysW-gamma-L-alpha-aminoadipyl-6-phosphate/LysW-L-glutamyl-5-phosphate reductase